MAETKVSTLPSMTTPTDDDIVYVVNDPNGTPQGRKLTMANLRAYLVA